MKTFLLLVCTFFPSSLRLIVWRFFGFKVGNNVHVSIFSVVVADFIKTNKFRNRKPYNPMHANCSESIRLEAYEAIVRLQKKTQKKIRKILNGPQNKGDVPFFQIVAIDTLDLKAAFEFENESSS
mgnify:CR=1 FL=1